VSRWFMSGRSGSRRSFRARIGPPARLRLGPPQRNPLKPRPHHIATAIPCGAGAPACLSTARHLKSADRHSSSVSGRRPALPTSSEAADLKLGMTLRGLQPRSFTRQPSTQSLPWPLLDEPSDRIGGVGDGELQSLINMDVAVHRLRYAGDRLPSAAAVPLLDRGD
jgi:hypothetical protein